MRRAAVLLLCFCFVPGCDETVKRPVLDWSAGWEGTPSGWENVPGPDSGPPADQGNLKPDAPPIDPGKDTDGDGLPDAFETLFGLDPAKKDSDADGVADNLEDEDKDSLTNEQELAAWALSPIEGRKTSPKHRDLLVELDYQAGKAPSSTVLGKAIAAFAAADLANADGAPGIALHVYLDEKDLPLAPMTENLSDRLAYLGAHGPKQLSGKHVAKMVHVIFASTRPGAAQNGGDTVASSSQSAETAGVLVYVDNLAALFPRCASPTTPKISLDEGIVGTLVHELGHTLQLGHDTTAGGTVNSYNIMSTDLDCEGLRKRSLGTGNTDASLGATEAGGGPRFSKAAAALIKLGNKISVEANKFETGEGYEM